MCFACGAGFSQPRSLGAKEWDQCSRQQVANGVEAGAGVYGGQVQARLDDLANYEKPKKIGLIAAPFTVEDGTLTPTQKVKRRVVEEKYRDLIDAFYEEENFDQTVFVEV